MICNRDSREIYVFQVGQLRLLDHPNDHPASLDIALDALEAKVAMTKPTARVAATPMPKPLHVSATTDSTEKMTVSQLPPNQAEPAPAKPTGAGKAAD